jgi:hypothetical protein
MTTTIDDTPTQEDDAYTQEEDTNLDVTIRRRMAFRPIHFNEDGPHPDRRPCPTWCWVGQQSDDKYDHDVSARHPTSALHSMDGTPAVLATLYQGESPLGADGDRFVRAATIEPHLEQLGQAAPVIRVHLRRWEGRDQHLDEVLKLSTDDAREFMACLGYLVETAETTGGRHGKAHVSGAPGPRHQRRLCGKAYSQ